MAVEVHFKGPEREGESAYAVTIEPGTSYETTATNGAGLVCDVYEGSENKPCATFSGVLYVRVIVP
jgi:hypothetical protein